MSYVKNNWQAGDKITAVKLNKMENGIEAASQGGGGGGGLPDYSGAYVGQTIVLEDVVVSNTSGEYPVTETKPVWDYLIPDYQSSSYEDKVLAVKYSYGDDEYQLAWADGGGLPEYPQYGKKALVVSVCSGETSLDWEEIIPDPEGYADSFLRSNGSGVEWQTIDVCGSRWGIFEAPYGAHPGDLMIVGAVSTSADMELVHFPAPDITYANVGEVLTVDTCNNENVLAFKELVPPLINVDSGEVLAVNDTGDGVKWKELLPTFSTIPDDGSLLVTDSNENCGYAIMPVGDIGDIFVIGCGNVPMWLPAGNEGEILRMTSSGPRWQPFNLV